MADCDICGDPVYLTPARYLELRLQAGGDGKLFHRHRECERLCGAKNRKAILEPEALCDLDVPLRVVHWPRRKKGNPNGALAKMRVSEDQDWRHKTVGEVGEQENV
jgi:hypothetical protein